MGCQKQVFISFNFSQLPKTKKQIYFRFGNVNRRHIMHLKQWKFTTQSNINLFIKNFGTASKIIRHI